MMQDNIPQKKETWKMMTGVKLEMSASLWSIYNIRYHYLLLHGTKF